MSLCMHQASSVALDGFQEKSKLWSSPTILDDDMPGTIKYYSPRLKKTVVFGMNLDKRIIQIHPKNNVFFLNGESTGGGSIVERVELDHVWFSWLLPSPTKAL